MNSTAEQDSNADQGLQSEMNAALPSTKDETAEDAMRTAVAAALDRKAEFLTVLDLSKVSDFTELFLICSGTNERQVQAIADHVRHEMRARGWRPLHVEGERGGKWILLDFGGDMVIHIFHDETRDFYGLERLWSDAPVVTSKFVEED